MLIVIFVISIVIILRTLLIIKKCKKNIAEDKAYINTFYKNHSWNDLPKVVVQIPLYNEPLVIRQTIDAVMALEYPHDRLEIQLLDDSTDNTPQIIEEHLQQFRSTNITIQHIRRGHKDGFKSGALDEGLKYTNAEYVAIFDADFIPPQDFLLNTIPYFVNRPKLAFIQTRWDYLNTFSSLFTRIQAADLFWSDISRLRNSTKFPTKFRGTGGVWRKQAIIANGGWYTKSLSEDTNLSTRAYYNNWQSKYLFNVSCLSELPESIKAYKTQRIRWSQGGMQNAIQMLTIKNDSSEKESTFKRRYARIKDLFSQSENLWYFLCLLILPPLILVVFTTTYKDFLIQCICNALILLSLTNITTTYMFQSIFVGWKKAFLFTPLFFISQLMPMANYSVGIIKAILGVTSEFKRTPKSGGDLLQYHSLFIENQKEKIGFWSIVLIEMMASSIFVYFALKISEYSHVVAIPFLFFSLCFAVPFFLSLREALSSNNATLTSES